MRQAPRMEPTMTPARAPPLRPDPPLLAVVGALESPAGLSFSAANFLSSSPSSVALKQGIRSLKSAWLT